MQVMVMNDDPEVQIRVTKGLMSKGFQVVGMETIARACAYVKLDPVDILITGERIGGRLSHTVALAAEYANPMVTTMLLTDRKDPEIDELYDLLPSLYALISPQSDPAIVTRLALSAVASPEDAERRMHRNATARQLQPMADWSAVFLGQPATPPVTEAEDLEAAEAESRPEADAAEDTEAFASWASDDQVDAFASAPAVEAELGASKPALTGETDFAAAFDALAASEDAARQLEPEPVPANPLFAPKGLMPALPEVRSRTPRPMPSQIALPEVVPARQNRSDWIAAKVRELEGSETGGRSRLHLA
ncbi:response regulator [Flavimaricola marinus]|uniref:Response regulatory domain-containing protein n=1 Tax=Flavimaricola marinus TaxID=1819565 RepID=A0A238LJL0_9RHOB|nr:response regulator [Flavimaricola marinus]SMY09156.1 hypothetical protein LOM8899_03318 [Flavimaricola marinus]